MKNLKMESAEAATTEFNHSGDEPNKVDPSGSVTVVDTDMPASNQNVYPDRKDLDEVKSSTEQNSSTEKSESELKAVESTASMEVEAEHVPASESANSLVEKSEHSEADSNQASSALVCEKSDNNIVMQKDDDKCVNEYVKDVVDKNVVVHLVDDESSGDEEPSKVVDKPPAKIIVDRKSPSPPQQHQQQQQQATTVDQKESTETSSSSVVTAISSSTSNELQKNVEDDDDVMEVDEKESQKVTSFSEAPTSPRPPSTSPKAFNQEYEKFLGGNATTTSSRNVTNDSSDDVQVLSDDDEVDAIVSSENRRKATISPPRSLAPTTSTPSPTAASATSNATKECSVKLVDINEMVENGEPLAKRARPSDPISSLSRKSSNEMNNIFSSKLSDSSVRKEHHFNNIGSSQHHNKSKEYHHHYSSSVDSTMKLFAAKRESKVTISPVRNKDLPMNSNSTGSMSTSSSSAMGSVTITKLSTGSSLSIESKDLKTILGTGKSSVDKDKIRSSTDAGKSGSRPGKGFENGFRLGSNHHPKLDLVAIDSKMSSVSKMNSSSSKMLNNHHGSSSSSHQHRRVRTGSGDSSIRCNKCREVYSTKEARRLHTCNSILDAHFLIEGGDRLKISPSSSKDSSDNSRSSSRADSPLSSLSPTLPCSTAPGSTAAATTASSLSSSLSQSLIPNSSSSSLSTSQGFGTVKKIKITATNSESNLKPISAGSSSSSSAAITPVKCKLIKDSKDELHIEGRPKLSIVKVPRLECGSGVGLDRRPNIPPPSGQQQHQPIVPKLKLSALPDTKRENKWLGGNLSVGGVSKDPLNLGESYNNGLKSLKVSPASSEASKKLNFDEKLLSTNEDSNSSDKSSNRKVELVSSNYGTGKIRIKYAGPSTESSDNLKTDNAGEKEGTDDGFPFTFSGRPTYSPSRVEPNGNVPTKESPRDASSKDSPASQADSGVFSIASSNSPSKGDLPTNADGTSPESPNRDRMGGFSDQALMARDLPWKSGPGQMETKHTTAPPLASPYSSASSNQSCNSNMGGTNGNGTTGPNSFDQSFNRSNSMGQMGPGGNNNPAGSNNHLLYSQQQQHQRQQQQQHLQYMSRMSSSDSEYPLFPDHMKGGVVNNPYGPHPGMNKMGGGVLPPGSAGLTLQQQQQQRQQQFSYTQRMFGYGSTEPEPKKKRGRPRKNETREPGTKRQYKRKPKVPPTPTGTNPAVPPGEMPTMGSMGGMQGVGQPPTRLPMTGGGGMGGGRPQQQIGNVYNFEDEEGNEDLGSIMPRRPPGSAQSQKQQKYSFGSSSDEEIPRPPPGAQHHPGMMGARPPQGMGGGQYHQQYPNQQHPHHYPQHGMGGVHGNQLMSAVHQKPPTMGIGTISGIGSIRGSNNVPSGMGGRPTGNPNMQQQQHMQQQHNMQQQQQQQQRPNEQGQMAEEDCSYSSEILTNEKTGGIGIKIKIKKAADTNTTTTPQSGGAMIQQQQQQQQQQLQLQQQQIPKCDNPKDMMADTRQQNCDIPVSSHAMSSQSPAVSIASPMSSAGGQTMGTPTSTSNSPFMNSSSNINNNPSVLQPPSSTSSSSNQMSSSNQTVVSSASPPISQSYNNGSQSSYSPMGNNTMSSSSYNNPSINMQQQQQQQQPQMQQQHHLQQQQQIPSSMGMMGPRAGMVTGGHTTTPSPLRSPYNTTPSPSQSPFGPMHHGMANPYRFGTPQQQQQQQQSLASGPSPQLTSPQHMGNPMMQQQQGMGANPMQQHQMGMSGYSQNYYNQGMNTPFSMQQQQQQQQQQYSQQGNFPSTNMNMGGAYSANQAYRYGMTPNSGGYGTGGYGQYGMMPGPNGQYSADQFSQYNNGQQGGGHYGNNMMYGAGNGMAGYNQRMMGTGNEMMGQPIPPHFRQQQQAAMMQQQQMMAGQGGHSPLMGGNMNMMAGGIGQPRISPSAMHKPMPGVGLPSVVNSQANRLQTTPLVSPQSLHSVAEQSPVSSMHNQPLTPVNNYGPTTPQSCNPMTPMGMGMASPMTPHGQNQMHQPVHQSHMGYQQQNMMSPMPQDDLNSAAMRSPISCSSSASNLRKIRRPSKSSYKEDNMLSPKADYRDEDGGFGAGRLDDFNDFLKSEAVGDEDLDSQMDMDNQQQQQQQQQQQHSQPQSESAQEMKTESDFKAEPPSPQTQYQPQPSPVVEQVPVQPLPSVQKPADIKSPVKEEVKVKVEEKIAIKVEEPPLKVEEVVKIEPVVVKEEEPPAPIYTARWQELEENILKKIFQYCVVNDGAVPFLVRASRVCSSWHKASQDVQLWTHLDLSQGRLKEKYRNDKKLEWFLKKYPNVLEIKLGGWKNSVSTSTLRLIGTHCPNLISLGLSGCLKLTNEDLKVVGDSFPKLERIDMSGVSPSSCSSRSAVSSTCLSDFVTTVGKRLTHFSIANNKMSGLPFVFKALSTHSSNLELLDISNITTTSRDTILINIEKFQKGCQKLKVLNANHTMLSLSDTPIKEQVHSPGFPHLQELYIAVDSRGYFDGMDDSQIERILKKSANLRLLDIRGCQHVTESCLIRLPTWDLERLVVAGCSAAAEGFDGLELVVKKWANKLVDIDISLTTGRAVNNAIDAFAESDDVQLRKLNLCGSSVNMKALTRLLKNVPTLEYINLSACKGLPRGIKRLYSNSESVKQLVQDVLNGKFNNEDDSDD